MAPPIFFASTAICDGVLKKADGSAGAVPSCEVAPDRVPFRPGTPWAKNCRLVPLFPTPTVFMGKRMPGLGVVVAQHGATVHCVVPQRNPFQFAASVESLMAGCAVSGSR